MQPLRKHRKQMTEKELSRSQKRLRAVSGWRMGEHMSHRMAERGIPKARVIETMHTGNLVEISFRGQDVCATMHRNYGDKALCVVAAIETHKIVTAWHIEGDANPDDVDLHNYRWDTDTRKFTRKVA